MEYLFEYKGNKIFKSNGFYTTGVMSADFSSIDFLKKIIDLKTK